MIVTEKEAVQLLCPHLNDQAFYSPYLGCRGSACMMWRWDAHCHRRTYYVAGDARATKEPERPVEVPANWEWMPSVNRDPACWIEPMVEAQSRWRGYCGLAGKP